MTGPEFGRRIGGVDAKLRSPVVVGTGLVVLALGVIVQWQVNAGLRRDLDRLSAAVDAQAASRAGDRSPAERAQRASQGTNLSLADRTELERLRAELNELKTRTQALANRAVNPGGTMVPLALSPSSAWKNSGRSTPSSAAETMMWAVDSGDVEALAGSIYLDQAAREKAAAILARMSESVRATYDTPEKLVALLLAREGDVRAMQVLSENKAGDEALVNMRLQKDDGKTKEEGIQFRRTPDGWRMTVSGKAVDKMGKKLAEPPKK